MQFFKNRSYDIFKMFINQIGMTIFGLVLSFATNKWSQILLLVSIFASCFYLVLIYTMMWDLGSKEGFRDRGHGVRGDMTLGLKISLAANSINILLAFIMTIGFIFCKTNGEVFGVNAYSISLLIAGLFEGMYVGIVRSVVVLFSNSMLANVIMYWVIILPSVIASSLGYIMGHSDRFLFGFVRKRNTKTK